MSMPTRFSPASLDSRIGRTSYQQHRRERVRFQDDTALVNWLLCQWANCLGDSSKTESVLRNSGMAKLF